MMNMNTATFFQTIDPSVVQNDAIIKCLPHRIRSALCK